MTNADAFQQKIGNKKADWHNFFSENQPVSLLTSDGTFTAKCNN